jgi:heme A synthase
MSRENLRRFAWATLTYTLIVILWGAYVRASGSGAGCGSHWPTCNGELLHRPKTLETLVELSHRVTSGLAGVLALIELVWALVVLPWRHPVCAGAAASMFFMLGEGAIGRALVRAEHVATDASVARAAWTSLHLSNTFLLVAALTCTAYWASWSRPPPVSFSRKASALLAASTLGLMLTGVSGAVTALGDTLFASPTLARGIAADFSPTAHFLQQLRVVHPIMATLAAVFVLYARGPIAAGRGKDAAYFSRLLAGLVVAQLVLGAVNFALQAPIAMQLVHLLVADLVWVVFVLLGASCLLGGPERAER